MTDRPLPVSVNIYHPLHNGRDLHTCSKLMSKVSGNALTAIPIPSTKRGWLSFRKREENEIQGLLLMLQQTAPSPTVTQL